MEDLGFRLSVASSCLARDLGLQPSKAVAVAWTEKMSLFEREALKTKLLLRREWEREVKEIEQEGWNLRGLQMPLKDLGMVRIWEMESIEERAFGIDCWGEKNGAAVNPFGKKKKKKKFKTKNFKISFV